jgi:hypothetical protein
MITTALRSPTTTILRSPRRISMWQHYADGVLTAYSEGEDSVPFRILRVFTIAGVSVNGRRGNHAHRRCSQVLTCLAGRLNVKIHDGIRETVDSLSANGDALLIPPLFWNSVIFDGPSTVLAVFCDELYEESDYIRNWDEYASIQRPLNWREELDRSPDNSRSPLVVVS